MMLTRKNFTFIFLFLISISLATTAQWRGPARDGHFQETGLLDSWPGEGPDSIFSVSGIGEGFSSAVEHNGTIYITGKLDSMDYLSSISMDGKINWQIPYGRSWMRSFSNSRSSACLEDNRAYVFSGSGRLVCIDAASGQEIWSADVDKEFEAEWHKWGVSETLLIVDDMVICSPSGERTTMVAFNKLTGELIWESKAIPGSRSYVSPVLYKHNDLKQILGMTTKEVYAIDPSNGDIKWTFSYYDIPEDHRDDAIFTNTPLFWGNEIFITAGYDYPAIMLELTDDGKSVTEKWRSDALDNHHGHVVRIGDYLYGANWESNRDGKWVCLKWETGELAWEKHWHNKGSIVTADGRMYIYEEKDGNVGLMVPSPEKFELKGSFQITKGEGPHWAHPAIYDGKLMIRHGDFLMVYNIRK